MFAIVSSRVFTFLLAREWPIWQELHAYHMIPTYPELQWMAGRGAMRHIQGTSTPSRGEVIGTRYVEGLPWKKDIGQIVELGKTC